MGRYSKLFGALMLWPMLFGTASAQEATVDLIDYTEDVRLGSNADEKVYAVEALLAHGRLENNDGLVAHSAATINLEAAVSDFGRIRVTERPDEPQVIITYEPKGQIDWVIPKPEPSYVRELNQILEGREPTNLLDDSRWQINSPSATLGNDLPLSISVEPFRANGKSFALLSYTLEAMSFKSGNVSGEVRGEGAFVISADYRDLLYAVSSYEGSLQIGDGPARPFRSRRGHIGLDTDSVPLLAKSALPATADLLRNAQVVDPKTVTIAQSDLPVPPDLGLATISLVTRVLDAQIGIEAENRGNIVFLTAVVAFAAFSTADSLITGAINIYGRHTGNDSLRDFPGIGATAARAVGKAVGKLAQEYYDPDIDPTKFAEVAEGIYVTAEVAAAVTTAFLPGSAANLATNTSKIAKVLDLGYKAVGAGVSVLNSCGGAILDEKDKNEKRMDCATALVGAAFVPTKTLKLPKGYEVATDKINAVLSALDRIEDFLPSHKDEEGKIEAPSADNDNEPQASSSGQPNGGKAKDNLPRARDIRWK